MGKSDLQLGIDHVEAGEDEAGRYLYWEEGTSSWYRVTAAELTELGEMLRAGTEDAYSHWCAATGAEKIPTCAHEHCGNPIADDGDGECCAEHVRCGCGCVTGERCAWIGRLDATIEVEVMPEHLRASHAEGGNSGVYPHNGAMRVRMRRDCAASVVESEGEWAQIVDSATRAA